LFTEWESRTTLVVEERAGDTEACVIKVEEVLGDLAMISVGMSNEVVNLEAHGLHLAIIGSQGIDIERRVTAGLLLS